MLPGLINLALDTIAYFSNLVIYYQNDSTFSDTIYVRQIEGLRDSGI